MLSVSQTPSLSEAEQDLPKRDNMLLAAVLVLVSILLMALIAIVSLVAFILWKLKLYRDTHGETACFCTGTDMHTIAMNGLISCIHNGLGRMIRIIR